MPTVAVVIGAGLVARLVTAKLNGPPRPPVVVFCTATVAGLAALVKVQLIWAAGNTLAAEMVSTLPASVPKIVALLPDTAPLISLQVALVGVKLPLAASVSRMSALIDVTVTGVGDDGVGVLITEVVIALGCVTRLVPVKLKVPIGQPVVIFWMASVAGIAAFVKVHLIWAAGSTLAALMVKSKPLIVPKAVEGLPDTAKLVSMQLALVKVKVPLLPSEISTTLLRAVTVAGAGAAGVGVAAASVVIGAGAAEIL